MDHRGGEVVIRATVRSWGKRGLPLLTRLCVILYDIVPRHTTTGALSFPSFSASVIYKCD